MKKICCNQTNNYKNSKRITPFWVAELIFNYQISSFDRHILDMIRDSGNKLASSVNPGSANFSNKERDKKMLITNSMAGLLSEYAWKLFLNSVYDNLMVKETSFIEAKTQIDLEIIDNNKSIEVRSSFPRNGIEFAICSRDYEFDILGPYANSYKSSEIKKNYYLRVLYHIPNDTNFLSEYKKNNFTCVLTGGATWNMMISDETSIIKNLIPEDGIAKNDIKKTEYRVVPFSKALDTLDIFKLINNVKNIS